MSSKGAKPDPEEEFEDAVGSPGPDAEGNWDVSLEELSIIRAELACEFPEDFMSLSDDYIKSLASKPYSKDMTKRRPLDYSIEKLKAVLKWRQDFGAPDLPEMMDIANGPDSSPEAKQDPKKLATARAVATSMNCAGIYFHGLTKDGKPIMWVRTERMPWYPDVDALLKSIVLLTDVGIANMPKGVTSFTVISDSSSPPPPHPTFLVSLTNVLMKGFPDRLSTLTSAPTSTIMQFVMNLVIPLMPSRLTDKLAFLGEGTIGPRLTEVLLHGEKDIPNFFGGPCNHDVFYPAESNCPNRGKGNLKFDFYGMRDRLQAAKEEFEAMTSK